MENKNVHKIFKLFIGGKFVRTESERFMQLKDSEGNVTNISRSTRKDIRNAVVAARGAFDGWNGKTGYERGQILYRFAEMLASRADEFSTEIQLNTGANKKTSDKEVGRCIDRAIFYAGLADKWMQLTGTVNPVQAGYFNFSVPEAVGVVGILLPDEPSLLAAVSRIMNCIVSGNVCIVAASETTPRPVLTLAEIFATCDLPGGVVNIISGYHKELIPHIAGHFDINSLDYALSSKDYLKQCRELCANNVKRFHRMPDGHDWYNDAMNEDPKFVEELTEIKTVWHTMGV